MVDSSLVLCFVSLYFLLRLFRPSFGYAILCFRKQTSMPVMRGFDSFAASSVSPVVLFVCLCFQKDRS